MRVSLFVPALCAAAVLCFAARDPFAAAPVPSAAPSLVPHRAVYTINLVKVSAGDGVRGVKGFMTYNVNDRCDGYTIETDVQMTFAYSNGENQNVAQRYAAWESKDGRLSNFSMQTTENGKPGKSYRGTITLNQDGSGTARYQADDVTDYALVPGTMLSTAHTLALIEAAASGKTFFRGDVIDGSFDQGPLVVAAAIARPRNGAAVLKEDEKGLSAGRYWPVSLAYFPASSKDVVPEYQMGTQILPNGVSRSITQDFGNFSVSFTLSDVEELEKPDC